MKKPKSVDDYMATNAQWSGILEPIREMLLSTGMDEKIKWMFPTYIDQGKNIIGIGAAKNFVGVWFFQGALLKDELGVLVNAQEGKTKAMRQWRLKSESDLDLKNMEVYVYEAIENSRAGREIKAARNKEIIIPDELQNAFEKDPSLKTAFDGHSKTNKRDFADHIRSAKREETRIRRLEKCIPLIFGGIGLNDKYKK